MLSENLEATLRNALSIATEHKHQYATYEHLLLALCGDKDVIGVLNKFDKVDIDQLVLKLKKYLKEDLLELIDKKQKSSKPTAGFQRIIQRASLYAQTNGQKTISGIDILAEFFFEHGSYALFCLKEFNLTRAHILEQINIILSSSSSASSANNKTIITEKPNYKRILPEIVDKNLSQVKTSKVARPIAASNDELEKFCVNLNQKARLEGIDCLVGRQQEIQRTIEVLCKRRKNNAILVGEPGVGKTAIAEGLAIRIVKNDVPDILKDNIVYSLDLGSLVAGTKFRGDFEERIKLLLDALKKNTNIILFIDEIHTIIGAGSTNLGALDAGNLLKPALAKGELRCIGATTFKEYKNFEKDMALIRRFQKIIVSEPTEADTLDILKGLKGYYEQHHHVKYDDSALKAAITLSERYIHDRNLPDKAIDLIDEAGSRGKIEGNNSQDISLITEQNIEELIADILNLPIINVDADDLTHLRELEGKLKAHIFGQDEAIEKLCSSIKLSRAGLKKGTRPTGCYLFTGPSGVGKTELAKQLALLSNMKLIKFDMSEFIESNSISRLLGSAPGYVGFDQGGMLTDEVDKYPYSVVLFDEIEKANPEIFNILLQVMDEGRLTDNNGKTVNFSHTIIILTSNLYTEPGQKSIGFNSTNTTTKEVKLSSINEHFSPEFRNRLDKIILFNPIKGIIDKIVSKNIKELAAQLADKKVLLHIKKSAKTHLIEKCFEGEHGARGLDRIIDTEIKQNIADEILFGKLQNGGTITVNFSNIKQSLRFRYTTTEETMQIKENTS